MTIRIVQITDSHLFADSGAELKGICVRARFEQTLAAVNQRFDETDRLLITGDLTHDEQLATYEILHDRLKSWSHKLRVLPGNHDDRLHMRAVWRDRITPLAERNVFVDDLANWRLIGLDSQVPGKTHGELGPSQLDWLAETLHEAPARHVGLFVHHPPIQVGSPWLDKIGLQDADSLWDIIRGFPQVRTIVCGHIHQELSAHREHVMILSTPSTGVQFRPETELLELDAIAPGFRILELDDDGVVRARVERVAADNSQLQDFH